MSIEVTNLRSSAKAYNLKAVTRLNLNLRLPEWFIERYGLDRNHLRVQVDALTDATYDFQHSVEDEGFIDGKLGPGTLRKILQDQDQGWLYRGDAYLSRSNLITYKELEGLDLHSVGHYNARFFKNKPPKCLIVHWGGLNPRHLYDCFSGARRVSSHAGIGLENGEAVTYQYLDLQHKSWHSGFMNSHSVGIDICQQAIEKWGGYYASRGYNVSLIENGGKGPDQCLSLDERILDELSLVIEDLCDIFDIPKVTIGVNDFLNPKEAKQFKGVLGHHHVSKKKWDCAPWWEDITQAADLQCLSQSPLRT